MSQIISRSVVEGETREQELANHQARCEMAPDATDLATAADQYLVNRLRYGTVERDRAARADSEARLQAIEAFDLTHWKEALLALFAVTYGQISDRVANLLELCYYTKRQSAAACAFNGFEAAKPALGYVDRHIFEAVREIVSPHSVDVRGGVQTLRHLAALAGFAAKNGTYQYQSSDTPSYAGHIKVGDKLDLGATLACGQAGFDSSALPDMLRYWAGLANQRGQEVLLPETLDRDSILAWARETLTASYEEEGSNAPSAFLDEGGKGYNDPLFFGWDGHWTSGRHIRFAIYFNDAGVDEIVLAWDSATGKPSTFLAIENLLALPSCRQFAPNVVATA